MEIFFGALFLGMAIPTPIIAVYFALNKHPGTAFAFVAFGIFCAMLSIATLLSH